MYKDNTPIIQTFFKSIRIPEHSLFSLLLPLSSITSSTNVCVDVVISIANSFGRCSCNSNAISVARVIAAPSPWIDTTGQLLYKLYL
jgi:hypothetical protein